MAKDFILDFSATEIAAVDEPEYANAWLSIAAQYVVTLKINKFEAVSAEAERGFKEGWQILYDNKLTRKTQFEYLKDAVPIKGYLFEALPRAI